MTQPPQPNLATVSTVLLGMMRPLLFLLSLAPLAAAFGTGSNTRFGVTRSKVSSTKLHVILSEKWFQLEEMEDKDSATTEIRLNPDLSVDFAETNGPLYLSAAGSWNKHDDGSFEMVLKRTFESGGESKDPSNVGAISYSTLRSFNGQIGKVGGKVSIEGSVHDTDPKSGEDRKVGFFEMIDSEEEMGSGERKELKGKSAANS